MSSFLIVFKDLQEEEEATYYFTELLNKNVILMLLNLLVLQILKLKAMNLLFTLSYVLWFSSEVIYNLLFRSKNNDKKKADKGSLWLIWLVIIFGIFISINIAVDLPAHISSLKWLPYAGIILVWVGIILRLFVVISLGKFFTVNVTIKEDHQLKKDGFYKFLRHPSYFMSVLSFIGFGISVNNWISLAFMTTAILLAYRYRIKVEEKALIEQFGERYLEYKRTTKGLIPFIY